ncbi:NAD binding domain of 6-phosphogluconate dehydrogenase [Paenibacillus sp. yr247]|nr:NAD binding domain of 6-phosphogluconate dehydrogenase [Paenibacillus sp. yr247]
MGTIRQNAAIGFIGTGVMGKSMAKNLIRAGYKQQIFSRTKSKTEELLALGAKWHDSPGAYLIDMTTSSPMLAKKIAQVGRKEVI